MRIGVFFDGTGNNKVNDIPRNKASNVAKLSELYKRIEDKEGLTEYEMGILWIFFFLFCWS